jgi:hypothetical protein
MTLSNPGSVGNFLGAFAVLVTLVYIAIQVRQNSAFSRVQTRQTLTYSQINYLNSPVPNPFKRAGSWSI